MSLNSSDASTEQDRRRFFRITDTIGVSLDVLGADERAALEAGAALCPVDSYSLISDCDREIENYLQELQKKDEVAAKLIAMMNKKIDCILDQMALDSRTLRGVSHRMREANISACGIGFVHPERLSVTEIVRLNILLQPTNKQLQTYGRIVGCDLCKGGFYVRIEYQGMRGSDQELLIRHLVQRQSAQLRGSGSY